MPSGAIMQLTSYGSENLYLVGNPQITFFRTSYQRHTNFAYEWVQETINNKKNGLEINNTVKMTVPIERHGDLLRDIALVVDLPDIYSEVSDNFKWIRNIGHLMIDYAEFFIGPQSISKLDGQWMSIWYELTSSVSKKKYIDELIGNVPELYDPPNYYGSTQPSIKKRRLRIPIPFWFTEHPGLAVPLIALQYTKITIQFTFRKINDLFTFGKGSQQSPYHFYQERHPKNTKTYHDYDESTIFNKFTNNDWKQNMFLDVKYAYLDDPERRIFSSAVSEYLITVTQKKKTSLRGNGAETIDINCFHPVKEMIWTFQRDDLKHTNQWDNYTTLQNYNDYPMYIKLCHLYNNIHNLAPTLPDISHFKLDDSHLPSGTKVSDFKTMIENTDSNHLSSTNKDAFDNYLNIKYFCRFVFNNHERQAPRSDIYNRCQEPYNSHTGEAEHNKQIYTMTFSEDPELVQPTGSLNFSTLTTAEMHFRLKKPPTDSTYQYNLNFYIRSMNVLRIMNGMGSLVFSN